VKIPCHISDAYTRRQTVESGRRPIGVEIDPVAPDRDPAAALAREHDHVEVIDVHPAG